MKRKATAVWEGSGKEGNGHMSTQSNVLNKTQYSYSSRFEQGIGPAAVDADDEQLARAGSLGIEHGSEEG